MKHKITLQALVIIITITFFSCENCEECPECDHTQHLLNLQPDDVTGKDAVFSMIVPNNNYGDSENIHLYAWTQGGILNVNRFVIDFDLNSIPIDSEIDSAFISLYFNKTSIYGNKHIGENSFIIQRIIDEWDESTVTWNTQPKTTTINQINTSKSILPTQDFTNIPITQLIKDILNDKNNSHGLMFKLEIETEYKLLLFASSENQDENLRPKLDVYYTAKD